MYYSKINKAKTLNGLCLFLIIISILFSNNFDSYAQQELIYGNYPVLRGATNPQEIKSDYKIDDAKKEELRQIMLTARLNAIDIQNYKSSPNKVLTNLDTIKALVNLSQEENDIKDTDENLEDKYKAKAIELGFITKEELDKKENENFFKKQTNIRQLNNYFSKLLNIQTRYKAPVDKKATRFDLANMIYDNKEHILNQKNIDFYSGQILSKSSIVENGKNKTLITVKLDKNIVIKKDDEKLQEYKDNQVDKIIPDNKNDSTVTSYINIISQNDVLILAPNGFTTDINNIKLDSQVNIYSKNNSIIYLEQYNAPVSEVVGVFESIILNDKDYLQEKNNNNQKDNKEPQNTTNIIKIKDYDNKAHIYKLHPDVKILQVNSEIGDETGIAKPVDKDQLSFGQDVSLTIRNNIVTQIKGYVPVEEELNAYVPPQSQLSSGTVLDVKEDSITLTNNMTYNISSDTLIMKGGEIGDYRKIKDGDRIKLYFDDIYSNIPSKIEVEGMQRQADKVIKAKVGPYSISKKSLTLKDTKELENGQWIEKDSKSYENVKIKGNIYANSSKVSNNKLKDYNNQEIYVVLAKNQGIPTIEKGKIRIGDSLKFNNTVKNIDHAQNTLQIDGNLVKFDNSTIIIKDGNIVQSGNLEQNINSNVETNMLKTAQIIIQTGSDFNIDKVNTYPYKIYRATLRDVYDYSILLGNDIENSRKINHYFMWQGGVWNRLSEGSDTPRLSFTEQTKIYDYDNDKALTIDELRQKQHSLNTFGIRPDYFNRQVYVVTKDDVISSISFIKSEGYVQLNSQNMIVAKAIGEYVSNSSENSKDDKSKEKSIKRLIVKNVYEYNSNTKSLQAVSPITTTDTATQEVKKTPVRKLINIEKASVIYDGKVIPKTSIDSLKDKELTIIFRQNRDKKTKDGIEELDAITIIAK